MTIYFEIESLWNKNQMNLIFDIRKKFGFYIQIHVSISAENCHLHVPFQKCLSYRDEILL